MDSRGFHVRLNAKKHHKGPQGTTTIVLVWSSPTKHCASPTNHYASPTNHCAFSSEDFQPQTCLWPPQSVQPTTTQTATSVPSSQVISNNAVKRSEIRSDTTLNYGQTCRDSLQGQSDNTLTYGQTCRDSLTLYWPMVKPAVRVWHYTDLC